MPRKCAAAHGSSRQHAFCRSRDVSDEGAHCRDFREVRFAAPLVHEEFLELERDRAGLARIAPVDEARLLALALERHVLANVEPAVR